MTAWCDDSVCRSCRHLLTYASPRATTQAKGVEDACVVVRWCDSFIDRAGAYSHTRRHICPIQICFMTHAYQKSENCALELKFAKRELIQCRTGRSLSTPQLLAYRTRDADPLAESGRPIVPIMAQGGGFKAGGWLGLLIAGALWIPLNEDTADADFDTST
eukprot:COSAG01_NODE_9936_length_2298_cov_1.992724_5_plen_161_part_00